MIIVRKRTIVLFFCAVVILLAVIFAVTKADIEVQGRIREIPIYSVENEENKVAITFDCAWGAEDIPVILNILKEKDVKATFFLVGEWVRRNPEEAKMIAEQGHDIGNHSENHFKMSALNRERIKKEITECSKTIQTITGQKTDLFRAPYGDYNDTVLSVARQAGCFTIQWSVDGIYIKVNIAGIPMNKQWTLAATEENANVRGNMDNE